MSGRSVSDSQLAANRRNSRKSTGPRTRAGKVRTGVNALRHGGYAETGGYARLVETTMQDLGEDAAQFSRLQQGLIEEWRPQGISQGLLVEDLASLRWERQRLERAHAALIARRVQQLELKHQRASLEVERQITQQLPAAVLRMGMLWAPDSPTKFQKILGWLEMLQEQARLGVFGGAGPVLEWVFGEVFTPRGALIRLLFEQLAEEAGGGAKTAEEEQDEEEEEDDENDEEDEEDEDDEEEDEEEQDEEEEGDDEDDEEDEAADDSQDHGAQIAAESNPLAPPAEPAAPHDPDPAKLAQLGRELEAEVCNVSQCYRLYIREHVEVTAMMRGECLAPTAEQRWLMRELNMVDRQIEKKMRLLWAAKDRETPTTAEAEPDGTGGRGRRGRQGSSRQKARGARGGEGETVTAMPRAEAAQADRERRAEEKRKKDCLTEQSQFMLKTKDLPRNKAKQSQLQQPFMYRQRTYSQRVGPDLAPKPDHMPHFQWLTDAARDSGGFVFPLGADLRGCTARLVARPAAGMAGPSEPSVGDSCMV